MPCSRCEGASTKLSLQFEPQQQLREEPYQVCVSCVPICYGRECIYKCRLEVAKGLGAQLPHEAHDLMAQSLSLGER